jgi:DNA-binding SARP family transcriptional activator
MDAMIRIAVRLLGDLQVGRGASGPAVPIPARKARALLAYLALPPGRAHPRDRLTALLWPDVGEAQARQSLRQALAVLRRALAKSGALVVRADTVAVNPARIDVDVVRFEQLGADGSRARLEQAVALYRGDLLESFHVKAPAFEDWLLIERERLRELARKALARLLATQTRAGDSEVALHTARRLLALDPLREDVHRAVMHLYVAQGQRGAALRQYQSCVGILRHELGVEPDATTKRVYQEILQQPPPAGVPAKPDAAAPPPSSRGSRSAPPDRTRGELALIGRDAEIARLRRAREDAWAGRASVVFVTGEAGIGKTRLLGVVVAEAAAAGGRVLTGRFHETEQILPFQGWIDGLRGGDVLGDLGDLGAWRGELARLFPELGPPSAGAGSPVRLLEAMLAVVDRLAARQRLLIVLDDLHWADEMSVRLLSFMGRRIRQRPVLLLGSAREEDLTESKTLRQALEELDREERLVRLVLSPLSHVHTVQLVQTLLRRGTAETSVERVAEEIWRTSEGNPFVIVEALRELAEGGRAPDAGAVLVPRRVRDLLSARLERLGKASRHLAAAAAVIGRDFSFALLQRSASLTPAETAEGIEELVRRRIMSAVGDGFDFTHDRIRRVVYDAVLEPRRRTLHAAVGDALETLHAEHPAPVDDRLAHHYRQAGVVDKALTYLVRVGETARARYALDDALRAFDQALELVGRGPSPAHEPRRVDVLLRKAWILSMLGRFPDILALLLPEADRVAGLETPAVLGAYHFRVALTHAYLGNQPRAREAAVGAIDAARRAGDETVMGQGHYVLALSAYWAGTPGDGVEHASQAIELLAKTPRRDWLGLAYLALGLNLHLRGDLDASLEALGHVEAVGRALADARLLSLAANGRVVVHAERGDWEKAVEAGQCALETSLDPYATASARAALGIAYLEKGDVEAASSCLKAALAEFDRFGHAQPTGRFMAFLSEAWLKRGHLEHARAVGTRALDISRAAGSTWALGLAERVLGRIALAEGRSDEAAQRLRDALDLFEAVPAPGEMARTHLDLAEVAYARGKRDEAARSLHTACELFEALGAPRCVARAVELAARLGIPAA